MLQHARRPLSTLSPAYREHLAHLVAHRMRGSFGVPDGRADVCARDVLAALDRETTSVLGDADAFALLAPWRNAAGEDEEFVAAIGWINGRARRAALLRELWRYGGETAHALRVALAPDEYRLTQELGLASWTTSVLIRTAPCGGDSDPLVRLADEHDQPFVRELLRVALARGFSASPAHGAPDAVIHRAAEDLLDEVRSADGICIVAADGDARLGHASGVVRGWDEYGAECLVELHDVFVPPTVRPGIGTLLERAFLNEAHRRGGTAVEGHITVTADAALVPRLLTLLGEKGWTEHRRLLLIGERSQAG